MRVTRGADLGALVAERREKLGMSQQQLADESGVTRDWLNRFERGKSTVTLHRVLWVLSALNLEMSVEDGR
ncbi:helix-turn-helix domain-containing protein [Microbacterium fluvii]|nr:helix-turn-helix domain-containing protein [Microbacterium fluvii]